MYHFSFSTNESEYKTMKIIVKLSDEAYPEKPQNWGEEHNKFQVIEPQAIELMDFIKAVRSGHSFSGTVYDGAYNSKNKDNFISQQVFCIDIDNKDPDTKQRVQNPVSVAEIVARSKKLGLYPTFAYYSFNSTANWERFRIVYVATEPVIYQKQAKATQENLIQLFPEADTQTAHDFQLFAGTDKGTCYLDLNARINIANLPKTDIVSSGSYAPKRKQRQKTASAAKGLHNITDNITAIRNRDVKYLASFLNRKETNFETVQAFFYYVYHKLDICELLDIPKRFKCIYHDDKKASANIFQSSTGIWLYKCHSDNCTVEELNIVQLIQKIASCDYAEAVELIKQIYNLSVCIDWKRDQEANIKSMVSNLEHDKELKQLYPSFAYCIRNAHSVFLACLSIATARINAMNYQSEKSVALFNATAEQVQKLANKDIKKVKKYLKLLNYLEAVEVVPENEIPLELLNQAVLAKKETKAYHSSFYRIPIYDNERMQRIEENSNRWRANGYKIDTFTYETLYRAEGAEIASRLFEQYASVPDQKQRGITEKQDNNYIQMQEIVMKLIIDNGYALESDITAELKEKGHGMKAIKNRLGKYLMDVINSNNLTVKRCNAELKDRFNLDIPKTSHPKIIYFE